MQTHLSVVIHKFVFFLQTREQSGGQNVSLDVVIETYPSHRCFSIELFKIAFERMGMKIKSFSDLSPVL